MNFEEAQRQHKRLEKIDGVLRLKDELVTDIDCLNGVAVTASVDAGAVELWLVHRGCWQQPLRFEVAAPSVSLDLRLRESLAAMAWKGGTVRERQAHLALLASWYYSNLRGGRVLWWRTARE